MSAYTLLDTFTALISSFVYNQYALRKKCPYSELFWSAFFPHFPPFDLNTELSVFSPNAGKCGKGTDQNNSEYGHFLRSDVLVDILHYTQTTPFSNQHSRVNSA